MNTPEPMAIMEQWLVETGSVYAPSLTVLLRLEIEKDAEAVPAILKWIQSSRDPFELQAAELSLRAFIDFRCAKGSTESHQQMLDDFPLAIVDSASVPKEVRSVANENIGTRPVQRQKMLSAAQLWVQIRPTDGSIFEWQMHRFDRFIKSKMGNPQQ